MHLFDALDFLAELTQHVPPKGVRLIRRYWLYSCRPDSGTSGFCTHPK